MISQERISVSSQNALAGRLKWMKQMTKKTKIDLMTDVGTMFPSNDKRRINPDEYVPFVTNVIDSFGQQDDMTNGDLRTVSVDTQSLVGAGATGWQIHATKDSAVRYNVSTSTTSTIGGPSTSIVSLKICSTNHVTEGNWTTVAVLETDQTITLAIALQSIQVIKGQLAADVPAGWFVKLVNSGSGTHAETFISGQKTIYG